MQIFKTKSLFLMTILALAACGGSSSSDSGILLEGTLDQGSTETHSKNLNLRHSAGEHLENIEVCALGKCSITDGEGQWGFVTSASTLAGEVLFTFKGHGIDTATAVAINSTGADVSIAFINEGGTVVAKEVMVTADSATEVHEPATDEHDHSEHEHTDETAHE